MSTVSVSTELPISAEHAWRLAQKPEMLEYVLAPIIRMTGPGLPDRLEAGVSGTARMWMFGVIPAWKHHITVVRLEPTESYTNEHGGPIRVWNHRLTFTPLGDNRCRYTDEIEIEDGWRAFGLRQFVTFLFRHRQRRWRTFARIIAD
ncbi:hypothetical protein IU421_21765 [Nocardia cyriacigeorgica]|uniref:SRPBCC family protein n=1 Tax=Nocardia cyriacigeorgica TaxID=135487 RepID=UPI001894740B|nr:SRPBCC family protein [Nocardia cyriacigeorgica]MBF6343959.1 hypothetical protein [Nocardia cyriacigeorgica]MBF6516886.1 hypothetical protein [Nocardia cyriacigeorgica]